MNFLKQHYGPAEGPLGFPMTDRAAQALDAILRAQPRGDEFAYRKAVRERAATELLPGERSDVSWISSEEPDRVREVVRARGMDDSQFKRNPIVTLQHCYHLPPVGRSLWRRVAQDGPIAGIKAKTQYPGRPAGWAQDAWPPDVAFSLVQADLLRGKSIGFLPTKVHAPSADERKQPGWESVDLVIDEWILLEYACCYLPCQQNAVVEAVSKALPAAGEFLRALGLPALAGEPALPADVGFTTYEEFEAALHRAVAGIDLAETARRAVAAALDRRRGRV